MVKAIIIANNLGDGHYAEPYAGGAGLALSLLLDDYVRRIHINDLDRSVYAFWHTVLNDTERLCRLIARAPLTLSYWRQQKRVQAHKSSAELFELGFSTFYLNRTNRSGIVDSGGIIGGVDQDGPWSMDARFNRSALIARIQRVASQRGRISITNLDAIDFLTSIATSEARRSLTYLDPPYFVKGQRRLYANYYQDSDHAALARFLDSYPRCWLVSYDFAPEILTLYRGHRCHVYKLRYTASQRNSGTEVMFFSDHLHLPPGLVGSIPRPGCRVSRPSPRT